MILTLSVACIISVLAASVSLWFVSRLHAELRRVAAGAIAHEQISEMTSALSARLSLCETRLDSADRTRKDHAEWVSQAQNLNLNRRGQVLRLHRSGESVTEIASSLRMGQGEVKLMIKVYELNRGAAGYEENKL